MTKLQFGTIVLLLGAIGAIQAMPLLKPDAEKPAAPKWEYHVDGISDSSLLESLSQKGAAGWDIVSARRAVSDGSGMYEIIFRRQKQ